jgi:hypothetical protein
MDDFGEVWRSADRHRDQQAQEFLKMLDDCCEERPSPGDRVVFAAGLVGHGFPWVRLEGVVLEVGQSSYKVEWVGRITNDTYTKWLHPALVTDVLPALADEPRE